ncbi:unknown [Mycoplasma sp. CAG:877]|nr:unknown [Mycoplasma sp. CAG:877]
MFFGKKYKDEIIELKKQNKNLQKKLDLANARIGGFKAANNRYRKDNSELSKINLLLQNEINATKHLTEQNEELRKITSELNSEKIRINSELTSRVKELSQSKKEIDTIKIENQSNKEKIIKLQGIVDNLNKLINTKMRDKVSMQELKNYCEGGKK